MELVAQGAPNWEGLGVWAKINQCLQWSALIPGLGTSALSLKEAQHGESREIAFLSWEGNCLSLEGFSAALESSLRT